MELQKLKNVTILWILIQLVEVWLFAGTTDALAKCYSNENNDQAEPTEVDCVTSCSNYVSGGNSANLLQGCQETNYCATRMSCCSSCSGMDNCNKDETTVCFDFEVVRASVSAASGSLTIPINAKGVAVKFYVSVKRKESPDKKVVFTSTEMNSAKLHIKYSVSDSKEKDTPGNIVVSAETTMDIVAVKTTFTNVDDTEEFKTSEDQMIIIPDQSKCLQAKFIRITAESMSVTRSSKGEINFYDYKDNFYAIPIEGYLMCRSDLKIKSGRITRYPSSIGMVPGNDAVVDVSLELMNEKNPAGSVGSPAVLIDGETPKVKFKYAFTNTDSGNKCTCDGEASSANDLTYSKLKDVLQQKPSIAPLEKLTLEFKDLTLTVKDGCRGIKCIHFFLEFEDDGSTELGCASHEFDPEIVKCKAAIEIKNITIVPPTAIFVQDKANTRDLWFKIEHAETDPDTIKEVAGKVNFHLTAEMADAGACAVTNARSPKATNLANLTSVRDAKAFTVIANDVTLMIPGAVCPWTKCLKVCISRESHATYVGKTSVDEVICKTEDIVDNLQCSADPAIVSVSLSRNTALFEKIVADIPTPFNVVFAIRNEKKSGNGALIRTVTGINNSNFAFAYTFASNESCAIADALGARHHVASIPLNETQVGLDPTKPEVVTLTAGKMNIVVPVKVCSKVAYINFMVSNGVGSSYIDANVDNNCFSIDIRRELKCPADPMLSHVELKHADSISSDGLKFQQDQTTIFDVHFTIRNNAAAGSIGTDILPMPKIELNETKTDTNFEISYQLSDSCICGHNRFLYRSDALKVTPWQHLRAGLRPQASLNLSVKAIKVDIKSDWCEKVRCLQFTLTNGKGSGYIEGDNSNNCYAKDITRLLQCSPGICQHGNETKKLKSECNNQGKVCVSYKQPTGKMNIYGCENRDFCQEKATNLTNKRCCCTECYVKNCNEAGPTCNSHDSNDADHDADCAFATDNGAAGLTSSLGFLSVAILLRIAFWN